MFDGDDMPRPLRQKRPRQPAGPGADFHYGDAIERPRGARDACSEVEVEQEILAQRFACRQGVAANDIPQRRQIVDRAHGFAEAEGSAIRAASRRAATRLAALARPVPAMSKAVPWSGEVRMNGNPSVTLTASSKASVLIGISAWS